VDTLIILVSNDINVKVALIPISLSISILVIHGFREDS
jgi:hypothetical protein